MERLRLQLEERERKLREAENRLKEKERQLEEKRQGDRPQSAPTAGPRPKSTQRETLGDDEDVDPPPRKHSNLDLDKSDYFTWDDDMAMMDIWDQPVLTKGAGADTDDDDEPETHTLVAKKSRQVSQVSNDSSDDDKDLGQLAAKPTKVKMSQKTYGKAVSPAQSRQVAGADVLTKVM